MVSLILFARRYSRKIWSWPNSIKFLFFLPEMRYRTYTITMLLCLLQKFHNTMASFLFFFHKQTMPRQNYFNVVGIRPQRDPDVNNNNRNIRFYYIFVCTCILKQWHYPMAGGLCVIRPVSLRSFFRNEIPGRDNNTLCGYKLL